MEYLSKVLILLQIILTILHSTTSSGFGRCPNYPSMPKFNVTKVSKILNSSLAFLIKISE